MSKSAPGISDNIRYRVEGLLAQFRAYQEARAIQEAGTQQQASQSQPGALKNGTPGDPDSLGNPGKVRKSAISGVNDDGFGDAGGGKRAFGADFVVGSTDSRIYKSDSRTYKSGGADVTEDSSRMDPEWAIPWEESRQVTGNPGARQPHQADIPNDGLDIRSDEGQPIPTGSPVNAGSPGEGSPDDDSRIHIPTILEWLAHGVTEGGLSVTTVNCYRRWLASYFDTLGHPDVALIRNWRPPGSPEAILQSDNEDAVALAEVTPTDKRLLKSLAQLEELPGNSRYLSYIDEVTLQALLEQLLSVTASGKPRYSAGPSAALMFAVTLETGLRPNEWASARYLESFFDPETKLTLGPVLEVKTLKQSNRREDNPLREHRYLLLDRWPEAQLQRLRFFLAEIQGVEGGAGAEGAFESYYNKVRMTLGRAWKRVQKQLADQVNQFSGSTKSDKGQPTAVLEEILSRSVSFYTARHTFAEEIRRSMSFTRFELAAMLGHSLLTNQVYYGPRTGEVKREFEYALPRPWPGDAEEIMQWDQTVNPLRGAYMQSDLFGGLAAARDTEAQTAKREEKDGVASFYLR